MMKYHSHLNQHLLHNINKKETVKSTALLGSDHDSPLCSPWTGTNLGML